MLTEYFVCYADSHAGLATVVNAAFSEGWTLQGGVTVAAYGRKCDDPKTYADTEQVMIWAQAMVKEYEVLPSP